MNTARDTALWQAFPLAFRFLSLAFLEAPTRTFIKQITDSNLLDDWPLQTDDPDMGHGFALMTSFLHSWTSEQIDALDQDYTRLFIGLERTLAPPYESVWLSRDHILFEKETLAVRKTYTQYGLTAPQYGVPDDHIGYELHFVSHLCELIVDAWEQEGKDNSSQVQMDLCRFLDTHLSCWITALTDRVIQHAETDYFKGLAILTRSSVKSLEECVHESRADRDDENT